jgi:tRNA(adenine34) deaminase
METAQYESLMREAFALATRAQKAGDVPVGAVVINAESEILGRGYNTREANNDPLGHAEINALNEAARNLNTWRLDDCSLIVTLEPCTMCAGAITQSRIKRVIFGAFDEKAGAIGSLWDVVRDPRLPHRPEVISGVLADEAAAMLTQFFVNKRHQ